MQSFNQIKRAVDQARKILILIHDDPDGDAIGSGAALTLALRSQGKDVLLPYTGLIRETAASLRPSDVLASQWPEDFSPDVIVILDSSDLKQLDEDTARRVLASSNIPIINIDHHASNTGYATLNCVNTSASSACEMIASYLFEFDYEVTAWMAGFLLGGIVSDTGRFAYKNTGANTLLIASTLISLGADLPQIVQDLESPISFAGVQLWGQTLSSVKSAHGGKIAWSAVTAAQYERAPDAGLQMRDMGAFLRRTKGAKLAFLIKEKDAGRVGISFRSHGEINCSVIAQHFGGGGHPGAAGCTIHGTISEAEHAVLCFLAESEVV